MIHNRLTIKDLGTRDYALTLDAMRRFTSGRDEQTIDELWLVQHPPIYTQGQAGRSAHIIDPGNIPIFQSDRGGQVTYHGPGQLIAYVLLDCVRKKFGVRHLVCFLENAVIQVLSDFGLKGHRRNEAPGVYIDGQKIASLGLRIRKGRSYHGIALNVKMDLSPFKGIHPCGFPDLVVTQLSDWVTGLQWEHLHRAVCLHLSQTLGYNEVIMDERYLQ